MLSLEVGRGSSMIHHRESAAAADRSAAAGVSTGLTLGLDHHTNSSSSTSCFLRGGVSSMGRRSAVQQESEMQQNHQVHHPGRAFPVQLDLLPRGPLQSAGASAQTGSAVPPVSCISQLTRHSLFAAASSGINNAAAAAAIDCEQIMPAPETHSSSRGGSPSPTRGIDMNEIPADADVLSSPRSCSISPPNAAFAFDIAQQRKGAESSSVNIKRERERERERLSSDAEADRANNCEVSSRGSDEEDGAPRKKLRLTKEQSNLLEESFKQHSTLNPKQKNGLAKQLSLRPRQVEVWFQNRRARTKLKQTEIDCELLKRCCETLTEENRRLQKELHELRAIKVPPPCVISQDFYMPLPAATLTMCPSCERLAAVDNRSGHISSFAAAKSQGGPYAAAAHFPHPHHPQQQPSAACQS